MQIALLEDDQAQAGMVKDWINERGFEITHVQNTSEFAQLVKAQPVDLAILDWELPDGSGLDALQQLKQAQHECCPVIFVTQRDSEQDIVTALERGADDYLIKPIRKQEFIARINALLRRAGLNDQGHIIELGTIRVDTQTEQVSVDSESIKLTGKDYQLACCLLANPGKLLSREYLLKTVWGVSADINTRTVDVHISRLRRKLGLGPKMGYCLKNIYQHGYRLERIGES